MEGEIYYYYVTRVSSSSGECSKDECMNLYGINTKTIGKYGSEAAAKEALDKAVKECQKGWSNPKVVYNYMGKCYKLKGERDLEGIGHVFYDEVFFIEEKAEPQLDTNESRIQKEYDINRFLQFIRWNCIPKVISESGSEERFFNYLKRKLVEFL